MKLKISFFYFTLLTILLYCTLSFQPLFAQEVIVSDDLIIRSDMGYQILGNMKGNFLLFRDRASKFEVQAFNEKLRATWTKELELDKRHPVIVDVVPDKETFCVFYRFKQKGNTILKVHKYDADINLIDSTVVKDFGALFYTPDLDVLMSEDKSKIIFFEQKTQSEIKAYSFDIKKMKLLWEEEYKTNELDWTREMREVIADNEGNMYLIFEENNRKNKLENHAFEILKLDGSSSESMIRIPMTEYLRYDVLFEYDDLNKKIVAGGLFSDDNIAWANGFFFLSFSPELKDEIKINYQPFEEEFIINLMEKEEKEITKKKKKNKGISETDIKELVLRRDGGILIIGEQNRHLDRSYGAQRTAAYQENYGGRYITDYFYEDMFILSVHPNGDSHWQKVLHKKQFSQDDEAIYSSYFLAKTPSALRLIFNDEIKYENTVSEYILTGNGEANRNSVMSTESQSLRLRFQDALQLSATEVIVPSEFRSRLKLVRLKY